MISRPPLASAADHRDRPSHAWVPPVAALLLLLWVLATLGLGPTRSRAGGAASDGAGGPTAGGTDTGAGVHTGAGAAGAGPGASVASAGSGSEAAAGSDARSADATGLPEQDAALPAGAPAGAPAAANGSSSPVAAAPTTAAVPVRDRRLGFSSDLLAPAPASAPVLGPVAAARASASSAAPGVEGAGGAASFFGQVAQGTRFVYVIDRSGSMGGARFEAARFELIKSIRSLRDHESFQVVFYSSDFMVMPTPGLLRATRANKEKAVDWVRGVSTGGGTDPSGALEHVITKLRPTTIWLLSDGSFNADVSDQLQRLNPDAEIQINTIAFHNRGGEALLKIIADENDGLFQYVGP